MGAIEDTYEDLDTEVSLEEFREAVEAKVEQMGGLADEETAAMLIAHELDEGEVNGIADIESEMDEVKFLAKVTSVGEVRSFERDEEEEEGRVLNADVADESGSVRISFWDEQAVAAEDELSTGDVLRVKGRPKDGYNGVEVNVSQVEVDEDEEIDVQVVDTYRVDDLTMGASDVDLVGEVLGTDEVRTFSRDDGSEGKVSNLLVGDETGRVRVTLWDEKADLSTEFTPGQVVEITDGYVREREGSLELHVGNRGSVDAVDEEVSFVPDAKPIDDLELDETADVAGVVRSVDEKRTFDRDDGSEGQVRNIRLQDQSGDIRVALWSEKADLDIGPGDELLFADVDVKEGWQDDLEASAGWQTTVIELDDGAAAESSSTESETGTDLSSFEDGASSSTASPSEESTASDGGGAVESGESVEFTGVVVQAGSPVILDDGEETMSVDTTENVTLGEEVTVRGSLRDGTLDADDVR